MITDPRIEGYIMGLAREEDALLQRMEERARKTGFPIVDRMVGRLIYLLTRLRRPRLVVELGSGFGYSAYWFAKAMEGGKIVLTDRSSENIEYARGVFGESGMLGMCDFRVGDALTEARGLKDIDMLFIDIDKEKYTEAAEAFAPKLSVGALIVADNALWYGRVLDERPDAAARGIKDFNKYMFGRKDFFSVVLPVRDGVLVSQKLG